MDKIALLSKDFNIIKFWYSTLKDNYDTEIIANSTDFTIQDGKKNLLVIDIQTIELSSIESLLTNQNVKILAIGEAIDDDEQIKIIVKGASGYAQKTKDTNLIQRIVDSVLKGEIWLGRQLIPKMVACLAQKIPVLFNEENLSILDELTNREMEVIKFLYCGECNHSIAGKMNISIRTVKAHLAAIYRKLNVEDRFQLVIKLKDAHIEAFTPLP